MTITPSNTSTRHVILRALPFAALVFLAGMAAARPVASLAPLAKPPQIDGVIAPGEWSLAAGFCGLQWHAQLDARRAWVHVGFDRAALYIACRSELPPDGKLRTTVKRRHGRVVGDDSVELWIVPPAAAGRPDGPRGQGYFQLIINEAGAVFDRHYEPGYGLAPRAWNVKLAWASRRTEQGYWEIELAIPMSELGIEELVLPAEWQFNAVRNWKGPHAQANITPSVSFTDKKTMAQLTFAKDSPVVQVRSLGDLRAGKANITLALANPATQPAQLTVTTTLKQADRLALDESRDLAVPPGGEEAVAFAAEFEPAAANSLALTVVDRANDRVCYKREFSFKPAPEHRWTMPQEFLTFDLSFDSETLEAERSDGPAAPVKVAGEPTFTDGVKGKGLLLPAGASVTYANAKNLTAPGAISFWVQLRRDRIRHATGRHWTYTAFFMTQYKQSGYIGVQDSVNAQLNLWLHHFPGMKNWNVSAPFPWQQDRWYHIAVNLHAQMVELFLDGFRIASAKLERPLRSDELAPFQLGPQGPYVLDEFKLFSRPLTSAEVRQMALGEKSVDGKISYLPSLDALVIDALTEPDAFGGASHRLIVANEDETAVLLRREFAPEKWRRTSAGSLLLREVAKLPDLEQGAYRTWLETTAKGGMVSRALARGFRIERYEWEDSPLGKSNAIIPPFTPLQVRGTDVSCILRTHRLGPLALWEQVASLDRDLLARPMALHVTDAAGKPVDWQHGRVEIVESEPHRVTARARADNPLVTVDSVAEFDYDGLMTVTLKIVPRTDAEVGGVRLDIPLKRAIATLFHASGEGLRANPAGEIPAGAGVVWDSRRIPQSNVENFIPYIWVGGEQRGICWAADWDKDWIHGDARSAVELVRENDALLIRCNFVVGPAALRRPREITFAVQASPVKPMPKDWRKLRFQFVSPGLNRFSLLWAASWGSHYGSASRYPLDQDFGFIHKLVESRRTGEIDREYIDNWVKRVLAYPGPLSPKAEEPVRRHVEYGFRVAAGHRNRTPPGKIMWYSCARTGCNLLPEYDVYGDEWEFKTRMNCSDSLCDYAVHYADKMMEAGMDAIYVDNTFTAAKYTWPLGEGWIDESHEIHPSLGMLSRTRQLIRRLAVMMYEQGREPFVWVHMTNANMLPMLAFAQATLGWEWKYGGNDYQERFTPGYMRAMNTGRQSGTIPVLLGGNVGIKDPDENIRVGRTGLAMALPHETFFYARMPGPTATKARDIILGFLESGACDAWPYWENAEVVEAPQPLLVTVYRTGRRILLVIGNMGPAGEFRITLKPALASGPEAMAAADRETGEEIAMTQRTLTVPLPRHDYALVEVSPRTERR